MSNRRSGGRRLVIVVSGPSGGGKTTLCERLLKERGDMVRSVSCTTRKPRGAEKDGRDYLFTGEKQFADRLKNGEFLEHAVVHGHSYGTLKKTVQDSLKGGKSVLLAIDVQGARQIRKSVNAAPKGDSIKDGFVDIFVAPPSVEALKQRLEARGEDAPETIKERLGNADAELKSAGEYKHAIVNDDLETAYGEFRNIIEKELRQNG